MLDLTEINEVRVERAKYPTDLNYDYALVVDVDGKPYVVAEFYGRIGKNIIGNAEKNATHVASLLNNAKAAKNAHG